MYIALAQRATQIQDESQEDCHSEQRRFESSAKRCKLAPLIKSPSLPSDAPSISARYQLSTKGSAGAHDWPAGAASASASASFAELVAFLGLVVLKIKYI
jgi:hypothetical protein